MSQVWMVTFTLTFPPFRGGSGVGIGMLHSPKVWATAGDAIAVSITTTATATCLRNGSGGPIAQGRAGDHRQAAILGLNVLLGSESMAASFTLRRRRFQG